MLKKYLSIRWALLGTAIIAIVALTAMNVYSLYRLHETTVEAHLENKKLQITEFTDLVRHRFFESLTGLSKLEITHVQRSYERTGQLPEEMMRFIRKTAEDPIFTDIYFKPQGIRSCQENQNLLTYDRNRDRFVPTKDYSEFVCDGLGIARTRMKVLIDEYRYNNKAVFDTHYSMTIALINLTEHEVFGYLNMPIDREYLVDHYLKTEITNRFGNPDSSGLIVWLRDWTREQTVVSSAPEIPFDKGRVKYNQKFSDLFDNWTLRVAFTDNPAVSASKTSLIRNFVVLGVAFVILMGALVFIFVTAQKERLLVQRQAGFLANVTHELKTPLAVMQAAGENLADGRVNNSDRLKSYGKHIHNEALRLKQMINKLLDVAKADAGQSIIEPKPYDLSELLHKFLNDRRRYLEEEGFTVTHTIEPNLPPVMIDRNSFSTILGNLVENAVKYSRHRKEIAIELYQKSGHVLLAVHDKGIGISKKSMKHIFEKFFRIEDPLTAESKGHGLGLSIVQNLVTMNGGKIRVESIKGKGSTFIVEFPILVEPFPTTDFIKEQPEETPEHVRES